MSNGFTQLLSYAALGVVGLPTILFLRVRRRRFKVAMIVVLGLNAVVLMMLASLIHGSP